MSELKDKNVNVITDKFSELRNKKVAINGKIKHFAIEPSSK